MPNIKFTIFIQADIEKCFDLARDIDIHTKTVDKRNKERAVGGRTSGLIEAGEHVTWEAIHFGVKQNLTAKIIEMNRPYRFVDVMVKGAFQSFVHTHEFRKDENGTWMTDTFMYKSPLGFIGRLADALFLEKYMKSFIIQRSRELKKLAEQEMKG
ncbi:SRPBCC family protein [Falsibacillus albus]|uniref:Cell division protein n=1 Tax=Falsibacillus albus TaxID=2478915 RepID=A0A3L7JSU1_9BACI|nr:SRPBCC family protein [Falsibacillus albus]RLQ93335.1 cell division protein [Falsibacillus albus]